MSFTNGKEVKYVRNTMKTVGDFLLGRLENRHVICFAVYFAVISALEVAAYAGVSDILTIIASRIWLMGGALCVVALLFMFLQAIKTDISQKNILSLAGMAVVLFYLFYICGRPNYADVSQDAAQQAAAGLDSFFAKDFNYTGKAFLGYPARQYLLVALPALWFGRSLTTLHLGFAIPFVLGIVTMYSGLRLWFFKKGINGSYAVIGIYAIFVFRYVTEYYINFEQVILPISITMMLIGLFLRLLSKPDAIGIFSLAWLGCFCSDSYTPVLASLGLLLVSLALLSIALNTVHRSLPFLIENRRQTSVILIMADINMIVFFLATLLGERADRVDKFRENITYFSLMKKSIYDFLTDKNAVFLGFMGILVLIYLIAALTFQLKLHDFLLALWVLGVFFATNLMEGYTAYTEAWVMQRALIVIPVLIVGMLLALCDFIDKHKMKIRAGMFVTVLVAMAFIGRSNFMQINQSFIFYNYVQPMKYMLKDLEATTHSYGISHQEDFNFILYTDSIYLKNPGDYFKFLYPEATVYLGTYGELPAGIDFSKPTIIYGDEDLTETVPLSEVKYIIYINKRYDETGVWYKVCIMP